MAVNVYKVKVEPYIGETHYVLAKNGKDAIKKINEWIVIASKRLLKDEARYGSIESLEKICEIDID